MKNFLSRFIRNQIVQNVDVLNSTILGYTNDSYDILKFAKLVAASDSAAYFNSNMSKSKNFRDKFQLLTHAMELASTDGLILELGVASGATINHIASLTKLPVYGFDSFSGLPDDWRTGYERGRYAQRQPTVLPNVTLIEGAFEETLSDFAAINFGSKASLIHVDCDLYTSTKTALERLDALIHPGTVIVFDEYFNYPGWQHHEFKAFSEYISARNVNYNYDSLVSSHQQVCVIIGDPR